MTTLTIRLLALCLVQCISKQMKIDMNIEIYAPKYIEEIGANAEKQENALLPKPDIETDNDRLFIICDAKGKDGCGDVVSQSLCLALGRWFNENVAEGEPVDGKQLKQALEDVCKELKEQEANKNKNIRLSMALLYLHRDGATIAHIGDCRIYHARAKKSKPLLRWFKKNYEVLYESADQPEIRLGKTDCLNPEVVHITDIQPNDVFSMCNAGMLEMDDTGEETFIGCIMSDKIGVMNPKEADLNYFKEEIVRVLCMYNHSAWIVKVKNVL